MARLLGVSLSGYYQWRQRQPSQHAQQKQALQQAIARVYARFDGSAGSPLITAELREQPSLPNSAVLGLPERCRRWACVVG